MHTSDISPSGSSNNTLLQLFVASSDTTREDVALLLPGKDESLWDEEYFCGISHQSLKDSSECSAFTYYTNDKPEAQRYKMIYISDRTFKPVTVEC